MAKKRNPFDEKPTQQFIRPDADIRNADWPKRRRDIDAYTGKPVEPKAVTATKRND